jgi:transcriptional regulator with XRE-family HTH domain
MPDGRGPLTPRRELAAQLKQLREDREFRLEQVAEALMISTSKLSRLENAQGNPQQRMSEISFDSTAWKTPISETNDAMGCRSAEAGVVG